MRLQGKNAIVTAGIRGIDRLKRYSPSSPLMRLRISQVSYCVSTDGAF